MLDIVQHAYAKQYPENIELIFPFSLSDLNLFTTFEILYFADKNQI